MSVINIALEETIRHSSHLSNSMPIHLMFGNNRNGRDTHDMYVTEP